MNFLEESDLFYAEKPYILAFDPPEGTPKSNMTFREHDDILVENIRGREHDMIFEKTGTAILDMATEMKREDFDDEEKVKQIYLREVGERLQAYLGATRVQIYEHLVQS